VIGILIAIHTIISILLVSVILMQASQGGGLSGTMGGQTTNALFGGRGAATILSKITTWLAAGFMILALFISLIGTLGTSSQTSVVEEAAEEREFSPAGGLSLPAAPLEDNTTGDQ